MRRVRRSGQPNTFDLVNRAVHLPLRAIYVAIPKTGTTSITTQIEQSGRPLISNPHLDIQQIRDALYVFNLIHTLGRNVTFPTSGLPTDSEVRKATHDQFESLFKFSTVRNPWARAVSLYRRQEGVQVSKRMSFETFCLDHRFASDTCKHPTRHLNQYDWLADSDGKLAVDYVLKLENLADGLLEIAEITEGRISLKADHKNRSSNPNKPHYRDWYSDASRRHIEQVFAKDIAEFGYEF